MGIEGRKKFGLIAGTVAAVLVGGGVAVAFWTTTGDGTGSADVGTTQEVTIAQDNSISGLFPSDDPVNDAQDIDFTITNPNPGPVRISTVTIEVDSVDLDPGAAPGTCDETDFDIVQPSAINADIAPGDTSYTGASTGASIVMINKPVNQDACKDATVNLSFTTP